MLQGWLPHDDKDSTLNKFILFIIKERGVYLLPEINRPENPSIFHKSGINS